jgi:large subunit ribosomal protein L2
MSVRKFKPTTPGQRHKVAIDMSVITASKPEKSLVKGGTKSGGRNNDGRMTMRYIGGGHKQKYRIVDFKRNKFDIPATVKQLSTIQIVQRTSRCCIMPTERSVTSLHQMD